MNQGCGWETKDEQYIAYHDKEWGVPLKNDKKLFEFLTLETFQAGLSWLTVLRKRQNFKLAFDLFDFEKVARYDNTKVELLMQDKGIIRNRLKIKAAISNAQAFITIRNEFGSFSDFIWRYVDNKPLQPMFRSLDEIPSKTELSDKISKDLKKRGFKFVGSTVIYAHMQATGMTNDHITSCHRHKSVKQLSI